MDVISRRSTARAGAIAVALLSGALVCESTRADTHAFGNSEYPIDHATLTLQEGSEAVNLSTDGFQGGASTDAVSFTGAHAVNTSSMVGVSNGATDNDFFVFNRAGADRPVTSAKLPLYSGAITTELNYSLYGATQAITQLSDGFSPNSALYNELGQGVKYGSFGIDSGNSLHSLMFALNAAAVSGINAAIVGRKTAIAISHAAIAVPEPSTWITMLAGFAGLGLAAYQRAARRRAASAAG